MPESLILAAIQIVPSLVAQFLPQVANHPDVPEELKLQAKQHLAELDSEIERSKRLAGDSTIQPPSEQA